MQVERRQLLGLTIGGLAALGLSRGWASPIGEAHSRQIDAEVPVAGFTAPAQPRSFAPMEPSPQLMARARAALARHGSAIPHRDRFGVVDFSMASRDRRLYIVDVINGRKGSFLVSHGRGSDPAHIGWVERFSNEPGSLASSNGTYVTGEYYWGQHGQAMRLVGLDPVNNNAEARAIVVHSAWYVSPDLAYTQGKIGRSDGCFAVAPSDLNEVLIKLGPGRMIYADRL